MPWPCCLPSFQTVAVVAAAVGRGHISAAVRLACPQLALVARAARQHQDTRALTPGGVGVGVGVGCLRRRKCGRAPAVVGRLEHHPCKQSGPVCDALQVRIRRAVLVSLFAALRVRSSRALCSNLASPASICQAAALRLYLGVLALNGQCLDVATHSFPRMGVLGVVCETSGSKSSRSWGTAIQV